MKRIFRWMVCKVKGQEIRQIRLNMGLSQMEFAYLVRTTSTTVSRWENNKSKPLKIAEDKIQEVYQKYLRHEQYIRYKFKKKVLA